MALLAAMDLTMARLAVVDLLGDGEVGTRVLERDGPIHDGGSHRDMIILGFSIWERQYSEFLSRQKDWPGTAAVAEEDERRLRLFAVDRLRSCSCARARVWSIFTEFLIYLA